MREELSDFIKNAYKLGKIKDVFLEYPPEEEWHKGSIENVISEDQREYLIVYKIGDIKNIIILMVIGDLIFFCYY